jgi:single-strand DNA-binding protein
LHKGSKVYIEGRVTQRKYTDKNGLERTTVDVTATDMEMLTPKSASSGSESYAAAGVGDSNDPFLPDYPDDLS